MEPRGCREGGGEEGASMERARKGGKGGNFSFINI